MSEGARLEVGLGQQDWASRAMPGNHDHWPGMPWPLGVEKEGLGALFAPRGLPLVDQRIPLANGMTLRLLGIDSDLDVRPWGIQRFFAHGSFRRALDDLAAGGRLLGGESDEVRVLLLHHSPCWNDYVLGIDADSRAALMQFVAAERISLVLTVPGTDLKGDVRIENDNARTAFRRTAERAGADVRRTLEIVAETLERIEAAWLDVGAHLPRPEGHLSALQDHFRSSALLAGRRMARDRA